EAAGNVMLGGRNLGRAELGQPQQIGGRDAEGLAEARKGVEFGDGLVALDARYHGRGNVRDPGDVGDGETLGLAQIAKDGEIVGMGFAGTARAALGRFGGGCFRGGVFAGFGRVFSVFRHGALLFLYVSVRRAGPAYTVPVPSPVP